MVIAARFDGVGSGASVVIATRLGFVDIPALGPELACGLAVEFLKLDSVSDVVHGNSLVVFTYWSNLDNFTSHPLVNG